MRLLLLLGLVWPWLVGALALLVLAVAARCNEEHLSLPTEEGEERLRGRHRNLLLPPREPAHYGTIYLDYYRTYSTWNSLPFVEWKSHSISKAEIRGQLIGLNHWYNGRVKFELGDVLDYDAAAGGSGIHENVDGLPALYAFAGDEIDQRNLGRISILVVKTFSATTGAFGAATLDVPFGGGAQVGVPTIGTIRVAPAVTFANNAPSIPDSPLLNLLTYAVVGFGNLSGALLAHEIGHVLGFRHTASFVTVPRESVEQYRECDLDLRYPSFDLQNLDDTEVKGVSFDSAAGVTMTTTYDHRDWMGRANIMSGVRANVLVPALLENQFGIYKFGYESIFEQITQCWFERSSAFEASL